MEYTHYSVLLNECITNLNISPGGIVVDATLGLAGHSLEIAKRLTTGRLICIDRDEAALERAKPILAPYMERVSLVHGNYRDLKQLLRAVGVEHIDGILFDCGVSSPQLDEAERGFSYMEKNSKLDMRMDRSERLTAADIVNGWDAADLKRILYDFGEERYAPQITRAMVSRRQQKPIETTGELTEIIKSAMPAAALREKQHPAKRSFMAIRIAVNDELDALSQSLAQAADLLNSGGRLCAISFHSLEDKIIKNAIFSRENGCTCPRDFPVCVCGFKQTLRNLTRKPILPTEEEIEKNPRSRSAKLRVAERI